MSFICHIHNYTEYNEEWNVFSAFNPSKCTHLEQWAADCAAPGEQSWTSCRSRDSNPQFFIYIYIYIKWPIFICYKIDLIAQFDYKVTHEPDVQPLVSICGVSLVRSTRLQRGYCCEGELWLDVQFSERVSSRGLKRKRWKRARKWRTHTEGCSNFPRIPICDCFHKNMSRLNEESYQYNWYSKYQSAVVCAVCSFWFDVAGAR